MNTTAGAYTRARGESYEYEATWQLFGYSARWKARVSRGGAVGVIDGEIGLGDGSIDIEAAVKRAVERRIEAGEVPA
jgi:hypothetical protein